jgi:hypothetical protein
MNNLYNHREVVVEKKPQVTKRKSILNNIRDRLSGEYNVDRHFKKNQKNLMEKVKFFEKKEVEGKLKSDMAQRLEEARELLGQIQARNPGGAISVVQPQFVGSPSPLEAPLRLAAPEYISAPTPSPLELPPPVLESEPVNALSSNMAALSLSAPPAQKMELKKRGTARLRKSVGALPTMTGSPIFNPPPADRVARQPLTYGHYNRNGTYYPDGVVEPAPLGNNSPQEVAHSKFHFNSVRVPRNRKTKKSRKLVQPEDWKYFEMAVAEIDVPPIFHPLTGQPISKEEDAIDILKETSDMLEGLIDKAISRSRRLKHLNLKRR